jgi:hypothetical protein
MDKLNKSDLPDWSKDPGSLGTLHKLLTNKSKHWDLGARVMCNNVRGTITGISKDGGTKRWVEWDDGTSSTIRNPHCLRRTNGTT